VFATSDFPAENPRTQTRNYSYTKTLGLMRKRLLPIESSGLNSILILKNNSRILAGLRNQNIKKLTLTILDRLQNLN